MTRGLAAEYAASFLQKLQNVAVADLRAQEFDTATVQRELETEVGHHRADDRPAQSLRLEPVAGENKEQLIAVDEVAPFVDHHDPVPVAVERQADMRAHARDRELE